MHLHGVSFFGKIPSNGDYVRYHLDAAWQRETFDWLVDGWNRSLASGAVRDLEGPIHLLRLLAPSHRCASALLTPSRDRVGRRFPFVLVGEWQVEGCSLGEVLLGVAAWHREAAPIAEMATRGLDAETLKAHVDALTRTSPAPDFVAHRAWRQATGIATLCPGGEAAVKPWLRALAYARSPGEVPEFVVRAEGPGGVDPLAAAIDLGALLGRHPPSIVGFTDPAAAGVTWQLGCGALQVRQLRPLLWPRLASEVAWDAGAESAAVPASFSDCFAVRGDLASASIQEVLEIAHGTRA